MIGRVNRHEPHQFQFCLLMLSGSCQTDVNITVNIPGIYSNDGNLSNNVPAQLLVDREWHKEKKLLKYCKILCIGTDSFKQTVQTQIRLLLKEQSDQGLHCLPFQLHLLNALLHCNIKLFHFLGQLQ